MKPYYQDDMVTLYHGDCLQVSEWLCADVLITDPPYGIDWAIQHSRTGGRRAGHSIAGDLDLQARDAVLGLWGKPRAAAVFGSALKAAPDGSKQVLVWEKTLDSGVLGTVAGFRRNWEAIYLLGSWGKQPATKSSIIRSAYSTTHNAKSVGHPHSKPITLMSELVAAAPAGIIADPFAGSGSTLVAASLLSRQAIGVEKDEAYCEIAATRLSQGAFDFEGLSA